MVELDHDPEYLRRIASGELKETESQGDETKPLKPRANVAAFRALGLGEEIERKILRDNATALFS